MSEKTEENRNDGPPADSIDGATVGGDSPSISPNNARASASTMHKDPLNLGIPLPVLVMSTPINATAGDDDNRNEGSAEAEDVEDCESKEGHVASPIASTKEAKMMGGRVKELNSIAAEDAMKCTSGDAELLECSLRSRFALDSATDTAALDEMVASATALSMSEPGGYAIGGPGGASGHAGTDDSSYDGTASPSEDLEDGISRRASPREASFCRDSSTRPTSVSNLDSSDYLVEATLVTDQQGQPVVQVDAEPVRRCPFYATAGSLVALLVALVVLSVGLSSASNDSSNSDNPIQATKTMSPTEAPLPTLERIQRNGTSFLGSNATSAASGRGAMDNDFATSLCAAVAAAVLDDPSAIQMVVRNETEQFEALDGGEMDYLISRIGVTMKQDVYEGRSGNGLAYTMPYLYSGVGFTGIVL
ncbi:expressed unknown protein [Seminavis robusta]|uniref:Uncharacterized protein n=1 Tax=Seminavis robusta TaxID=568900 RepID=A0A9N8HZR3_9STRA|nr:expressed unknown protein [Seminavis robusta]|eukprot:Sro3995_g352400.1 n/a (420) ;mRNA; f:1905-3425